MRKLPGGKYVEVSLHGGILDGRTKAGEARAADFRILLNCATSEERGRARLGGWGQWRSSDPGYSNEDLHDQLLGAQGSIVDGCFVNTDGQREAITLLLEAPSTQNAVYFIAATKSRIYCSTGKGRNYRLIADGLGGPFAPGESRWHKVRTRAAQLGDFMVFTNGVDPVLAWPLGGGTLPVESGDDRQWCAKEISELLDLGIFRAEVICEWQGFVFIGNVNINGTQERGQTYWCSFNRPLEWTAGGESSAGTYDFGKGETILNIAPVGGTLRYYTDKAIYNVIFTGGDTIFSFQEIYRGEQVVAFKDSFVNVGEAHIWLTQDSCAVSGEFDKTPRRLDWLHKSTGFIFNGLDGRLLKSCPVDFQAFNPIDRNRCHQIASGFDTKRSDLWLSWPTQRTSDTVPDDPDDFDGVRRMTLILNLRYSKATLVDHGFSAFTSARPHSWDTIRDFLFKYGVCDPAQQFTPSYNCCVIEILMASELPTATTLTPYSTQLSASGGVQPYTWTVISGTLPPGLAIGDTGILEGTPTTPGSYAFTLGAVDVSSPETGCSKEFTLIVL